MKTEVTKPPSYQNPFSPPHTLFVLTLLGRQSLRDYMTWINSGVFRHLNFLAFTFPSISFSHLGSIHFWFLWYCHLLCRILIYEVSYVNILPLWYNSIKTSLINTEKRQTPQDYMAKAASAFIMMLNLLIHNNNGGKGCLEIIIQV